MERDKKILLMINKAITLMALPASVALRLIVMSGIFIIWPILTVLLYGLQYLSPERYGDLSNSMIVWLSFGHARAWLQVLMVLAAILFVNLLLVCFSICFEKKIRQSLPLPSERVTKVAGHGEDLEVLMENLRQEDLEYLAFFDFTGRKLSEWTSFLPDQIDYYVKETPIEGAISVHNHPGLVESSISSGDLDSMIRSRQRKMIVVTRNYTYTLENPRWWEKNNILIAGEASAYLSGLLENQGIWALIRKTTLPLEYRRDSVWAIRETAAKYGLEFSVQNRYFNRCKKFLVLFPVRATRRN